MHKAILVVALSLNTKNNAICAMSLVRGFVEKSFEPAKTVAMETKVCHVIKLWTSFQKNLVVGC